MPSPLQQYKKEWPQLAADVVGAARSQALATLPRGGGNGDHDIDSDDEYFDGSLVFESDSDDDIFGRAEYEHDSDDEGSDDDSDEEDYDDDYSDDGNDTVRVWNMEAADRVLMMTQINDNAIVLDKQGVGWILDLEKGIASIVGSVKTIISPSGKIE